MREVTLVTGPPCSGKSTHVTQHASDGDLIVDFDTIARELGSPRPWIHPPEIRRRAEVLTRQRLSQVRAMTEGRAWIIRSVPNPGERQRLADWLHADHVLVLLPDTDTLQTRMRERPQPGRTLRGVNTWMRNYAPREGEQIFNPEQKPGA